LADHLIETYEVEAMVLKHSLPGIFAVPSNVYQEEMYLQIFNTAVCMNMGINPQTNERICAL